MVGWRQGAGRSSQYRRDVFADPHVRIRKMLAEVEPRRQRHHARATPIKLTRRRRSALSPAASGEHTAEILEELRQRKESK